VTAADVLERVAGLIRAYDLPAPICVYLGTDQAEMQLYARDELDAWAAAIDAQLQSHTSPPRPNVVFWSGTEVVNGLTVKLIHVERIGGES
jgi:hypothetical protein